MLSISRYLLLLVSALLVHAEYYQKCTEVSSGETSGVNISPDPEVVTKWQRRHIANFTSPFHECKLQGITLFVCDILPPEVNLEDDLSQASILRLGPLWPPLLIQAIYYCESSAPKPTTSAKHPYIIATTAKPSTEIPKRNTSVKEPYSE